MLRSVISTGNDSSTDVSVSRGSNVLIEINADYLGSGYLRKLFEKPDFDLRTMPAESVIICHWQLGLFLVD